MGRKLGEFLADRSGDGIRMRGAAIVDFGRGPREDSDRQKIRRFPGIDAIGIDDAHRSGNG